MVIFRESLQLFPIRYFVGDYAGRANGAFVQIRHDNLQAFKWHVRRFLIDTYNVRHGCIDHVPHNFGQDWDKHTCEMQQKLDPKTIEHEI